MPNRLLRHSLLAILMIAMLVLTRPAQTQTTQVYVCSSNGGLSLRNTPAPQHAANTSAMRNCTTKTIVMHGAVDDVRSVQRALDDPRPTAQTLMVGAYIPSAVQQQRDFGRAQIVRSELDAAKARLTQLNSAYRNHHISTSNDAQSKASRMTSVQLKKNIQLTESSINALQRELARIDLGDSE